ncbi:MAG: uncharacterized protein JWL62_2355 [Hyphomicrobiales bacterium]|nr:uncharacterized protein [Hyphomicrobiales bacterium]
MSFTPDPEVFHDVDFETIEAAVNETARGRWFLAEFARRNRVAETDRLVETLQRIESAVAAPQEQMSYDAARFQGIAQNLSRRLADITAHLRAAGLPMADEADVEPLEQIALVPDERRLIEQRMIEPKPFFIAPEAVVPPVPPLDMKGHIGRLSERIESMRRLVQPVEAEPAPAPVVDQYPSLAEVETWPLTEKLRFFG